MRARFSIPPILLAAVVLAACQDIGHTLAEAVAPEVAGAWRLEEPAGERILVLDAEGTFGVVGSDTVGSWSAGEEVLVLSVARPPTSRVERTPLVIRLADEETLVLAGEARYAGRYRRADHLVGHLAVTARYPDKIALPPDAVVRVELRDVSRADAPSILVAAIEAAGGGLTSPMEFHLHYPLAGIDPRMTYAVSAVVRIGERPWMRTTTHVPALTRGAPRAVELSLEGVSQGRAGGGPGAGMPATAAASPTLHGDLVGVALPATFSDGAVVVSLWPDGTFRLREVPRGPGAEPYHDRGRWSLEGNRLFLRGGAEAPRDYKWLEGDALERVDPPGNPLGFPVLAPATFDPVAGPARLVGRLRCLADGPVFEDCLAGRAWPVAREEAWPDLERACGAAGPGAVLVTVTGRFEARAAADGRRAGELLVVSRLDQARPGDTCRPGRADTALNSAWWRLVVVDDRLVRASAEGRRWPHLVLAADGRARGSGGCNAFSGSYRAEAGSIAFGEDMAATLMACREPVQSVEQAFFAALRETARYEVSGDRLDLYDGEGRHRAHLQATWFE